MLFSKAKQQFLCKIMKMPERFACGQSVRLHVLRSGFKPGVGCFVVLPGPPVYMDPFIFCYRLQWCLRDYFKTTRICFVV